MCIKSVTFRVVWQYTNQKYLNRMRMSWCQGLCNWCKINHIYIVTTHPKINLAI
jgi:hypothetical protein